MGKVKGMPRTVVGWDSAGGGGKSTLVEYDSNHWWLENCSQQDALWMWAIFKTWWR